MLLELLYCQRKDVNVGWCDGVGKVKNTCSQLTNYKFLSNTKIYYIYLIMCGTCFGNILTIVRH
jgi:hypothetical protein